MPNAATADSLSLASAYSRRIGEVSRELLNNLTKGEPAAVSTSEALQQLDLLPEPGCEAWKYSPINRLYETLNGLPTPLNPSDLTDTQALLGLIDSQRYPLGVMTALTLHSATQVTASEGEQIILPSPTTGHHWQHVEIPANTRATLIQRRSPVSGAVHITTVSLGEGAKVEHAFSGCPDSGTSWQLVSINQQANSDYKLHQLSLGGQLERIDTHIRLLGRGANATLTGALLCGDNDRCDNQTVLEHAASGCTSTARYHGLANHSGKLTFGGRIHIHKNAADTDARLHNPNLLLSDSAEINTKPELEIYNDDVACAHGATVGQLDDDAVFYLRSRGISRASAFALLLRGFVSEALQNPASGTQASGPGPSPDIDWAQELTAQRLSKWTL